MFNYVSVGTPITLTTGHTYEITAPLWWTQDFHDISSFTMGSAIQTASFNITPGWNGWDLGDTVYNYAGQTTEGTYTAGSPATGAGHLSANFLYTAASIPEPGTATALLGGAAVMTVAFRRRFRK